MDELTVLVAQLIPGNRMVGLEDLSEAELDQLRKFYMTLSRLAASEDDITCTHSIDAAEENHQIKMSHYRDRKDSVDYASDILHQAS